jgi:hypothetical protein
MTPETKSAPTALTPNVFTRSKHKFARWNTVADGAGMSYANGVVFPFTASTTLYAQWTASTKIDPTRKVIFDANGGSGSMKPESNNVLASLKSNKFQRKGFSFVQWNTAANGSGAKLRQRMPRIHLPNRSSLFAQWRAAATLTFTVTFDANRGSGSMSPETKKATAALTTQPDSSATGSSSTGGTPPPTGRARITPTEARITSMRPPSFSPSGPSSKPPVVLPAVHAVVALSPFRREIPGAVDFFRSADRRARPRDQGQPRQKDCTGRL